MHVAPRIFSTTFKKVKSATSKQGAISKSEKTKHKENQQMVATRWKWIPIEIDMDARIQDSKPAPFESRCQCLLTPQLRKQRGELWCFCFRVTIYCFPWILMHVAYCRL